MFDSSLACFLLKACYNSSIDTSIKIKLNTGHRILCFFFQNAHYVVKLMRFLQASVGNLLVIETTRSDRLTYKKECWWNVALSSKHAAKVIYACYMFLHVHACSSLPRYKGWCGTKSRINLPTGSNVSTTSAHSAPYQIVWALAVRSYPLSRNQSKSTEVPGIQNSIPDCFKNVTAFSRQQYQSLLSLITYLIYPYLSESERSWKKTIFSTVHLK